MKQYMVKLINEEALYFDCERYVINFNHDWLVVKQRDLENRPIEDMPFIFPSHSVLYAMIILDSGEQDS